MGTGAGDLHERRRTNMAHASSSSNHQQQQHHHLYEDIMVAPGDFPSHAAKDSKTKKQRRSTLTISEAAVPRWAMVVVTVFVVLALLLAKALLQHRHRRVILHVMKHPWAHGRAALMWNHRSDGFRHHFDAGAPRFVTVVLPSVVNPQHRPERLLAIHDTWGPYARAIYVVHNDTAEFPLAAAQHLTISETLRPHDPYLYPQNLLLPPHIGVEDGIQRLVYTIQTIYKVKNPDFAFFVNDHTFVLPEHLCHWLEGRDPHHDLYAGHALHNHDGVWFNSGAAGYVLSRETMRQLVAQWEAQTRSHPDCWMPWMSQREESPENHNNKNGANTNIDKDTVSSSHSKQQQKWLQGNPGLVIASCLHHLGVHAMDTRAILPHAAAAASPPQQQQQPPTRGGHVFHAFPLTRVVSGAVDDWYVNKHKVVTAAPSPPQQQQPHDWPGAPPPVVDKNELLVLGSDASYATLATGPDCCAADTVSFHYVERHETRALFAVRERLRHDPHLTEDAPLQSLLMQHWPTQKKDIGGYSRGLPQLDDSQGWSQLMATVRKISVGSLDEYC